jgi:hypothetical protein
MKKKVLTFSSVLKIAFLQIILIWIFFKLGEHLENKASNI